MCKIFRKTNIGGCRLAFISVNFEFMLILSEFVVDLYTFLNALYLIFTTFSCGGDYQTFRHQKRIVKSTQYT